MCRQWAFLIGIGFITSACSVLIPWNPRIGGMEFNRRLSFNFEGIGIHISKMGFVNSHFNPRVQISIKNLRADSIKFNAKDFKLIVGSDTLSNSYITDYPIVLGSSRQSTLSLRYECILQDTATKVFFIFGPIKDRSDVIQLPSIEFNYAYKNGYRTKFAN